MKRENLQLLTKYNLKVNLNVFVKSKIIKVLLILFTNYLFLSVVIVKQLLIVPTLLSWVNLIFWIFVIFTRKEFQHNTIKIFLIYHILTMILPLIYIILAYKEEKILDYLEFMSLTPEDIIKSNFLILIHDVLLCIFYIFFYRVNSKFSLRFTKYFINNINKYLFIFLLLLISYFSKLYLVSIGAWFQFIQINGAQYVYMDTIKVLSSFDILVLSYFAFKAKIRKTNKFDDILTIIVASISWLFAIASASRTKIFLIAIPIILRLFYSKRKILSLFISLILLLNIGAIFECTSFLRQCGTKNIFYNIKKVYERYKEKRKENKPKAIKDNKVLQRLNYQFAFSKAVKHYDAFPKEYKYDYLNNIIGLIPRPIWPGKPVITLDYNKIGREVGLLAESDFGTSAGFRPLGEAYYELGIVGVLLLPIFTAWILSILCTNLKENHFPGFVLSIILGLHIGLSDTYVTILPSLLKAFLIYYFVSLPLVPRYVAPKAR